MSKALIVLASQAAVIVVKNEDKNLPLAPARIILVDDHTLVRAGIRALLERIEGFEIVGEASNGAEALQLINKLLPDIVLLDIAMPGINGLEVLREVTRLLKVRVIILTAHETVVHATYCLRSGASGFLPKSAASTELELALRTVLRGERYLSPTFSNISLSEHDMRTSLTARQIEVLQRIAMGRTTKDIADALNISVKTVETHRAQLMDRLGIYDVAGLVRYAIRMGLVMVDY